MSFHCVCVYVTRQGMFVGAPHCERHGFVRCVCCGSETHRLLVGRGGCCVVAIVIDMLIAIQILTAVVPLSCGSYLVSSGMVV